jgi:hypothetical protein
MTFGARQIDAASNMTCKHLFIDVCHLARELCQLYGIDAAPRPHKTACEFCTHKADPPQQINEVIISLALAQTRDRSEAREQILRDHGHRLQRHDAQPRNMQLAEIMHGQGPGSELWRLLSELGIPHKPTCGCLALAERMNAWGPFGCRLARPEIVSLMRVNAKEYGWTDVAKAAAKAVTTGVAWRLDLTDVYGSLVDEAISRAADES